MFVRLCLFFQAAATLKDFYKKHPVLYNSSIVCSFEPKVIYRVDSSNLTESMCMWGKLANVSLVS